MYFEYFQRLNVAALCDQTLTQIFNGFNFLPITPSGSVVNLLSFSNLLFRPFSIYLSAYTPLLFLEKEGR